MKREGPREHFTRAVVWAGLKRVWMSGRTCDIKIGVAVTTSSSKEQEVHLSQFIDKSPRRRQSFFSSRSMLAVLLALIVVVFLYQPVQVEGNSMLPELENHERIFVNRLAYRLGPIHRYDIIVFRYPLDPREYFIKRVVGLPGEWVSINEGTVFIDGKPLRESFIPKSDLGHETEPPVYVPPGHYYVLGDHRGFSNDSRAWGTLDRRLVYGKAVFAYRPLSEFGRLN
jgi:signal peptidase I